MATRYPAMDDRRKRGSTVEFSHDGGAVIDQEALFDSQDLHVFSAQRDIAAFLRTNPAIVTDALLVGFLATHPLQL
jgi:hypothetical protein